MSPLPTSIAAFTAVIGLAYGIAGDVGAGDQSQERGAAAIPCESARVIGVRARELSEAQVVGPQSPAADERTPSGQLRRHAFYFIALECAGKSYVARVVGAQDIDPQRLGTTLSLRSASGGRILARGASGAEFEVTLAPASKP